ncbi:MAG TPA: DUF1003 domain-containing protein [Chthoniobacterales bacterium]|nr:DUF1003 domain-containing protein [Chthoniobacterales bacterium]
MTAFHAESSSETGINVVLQRNIRTLLAHRAAEERAAPVEEKIADAITRFTGSMLFVYLHFLVFGFWIVVNLGWLGIRPFDPSFITLAMVASVEAIFLSTFVLISQNRMAAISEKRADLDLQISLLAEHEITRLLQITMAMAQKIGVQIRSDGELAELQQDVAPEKVLSKMDQESHQQRTKDSAPY